MRVGIYNARVGFSLTGGTETFLREMIDRIQDEHEIILYCGAGDLLEEVRDFDITIKQIPLKKKESRVNFLLSRATPIIPAEIESLTMYWNARRLGVFQRIAEEVDVLSTHYYLDNLLVSRSVDVPTVFRFPGIKQPSVRWKAMARLAEPDLYLANSQATAQRLRRWLDLEVEGTVYAGVDIEQFSIDTDPTFKCDRPVILFVGRLDEGKGLHDLLKAKSRIGERAQLVLVGSGTIEGDLRAKAQSLGIQDDVVFVGSIPHDEIHHYYSSADIFCLPSYHEGFPIVNMEALASGCAVVSTNIDSIEEQLDDGKNALLVQPGDIDGITDAFERLLDEPCLKDRLIENGLERATELSWDQQAAMMLDYYKEAAEAKEDD